MKKIISILSEEASYGLVVSCAELYCRIWKEPPWSEDFWTVPGVLEDINCELDRSGAAGFLAVNGQQKAVGFTWGYPASQKDMEKISGGGDFSRVLRDGEKAFYIDELGVATEHRGQGIGIALSQELIAEARRSGSSSILLRTDEKAAAAQKLYRKLGFKELPTRDRKYENRTYWLLEI